MSGLKDLEFALKEAKRFIEKELPDIIGIEAVNEFKGNFNKESFDGKPWKKVKRTDPASTWYGFDYGKRSKKPSGHPSRKKAVKPYKARKENPVTNYSSNATKRSVLRGRSGDLQKSIKYKATGGKIIISSDKPYAKIHNEGGKMRVFGKASATMPQRKFIGKSAALEKTIQKEINKKLTTLFKKI